MILNADEIRRALTRITYEILEANKGSENLMIIGIRSRGLPLAQRIAERIAHIHPEFDVPSSLGALDITAYRDDLTEEEMQRRTPGETLIPGSLDGKNVVLVDDVLYSGRTVRAALDALNAHGRPATVRLAVLVDRGHRQLPIRADHVGKNIPTSASENVRVYLEEIDGQHSPPGTAPGATGYSGTDPGTLENSQHTAALPTDRVEIIQQGGNPE
ncbi:MAG: bifunctional pyr operon transcriptional regulator/uracil phosphoribosyltransferase PyrR [Rothia sp. (in: high G+C Gram-positive bacteria)]|nr:bifunctional pyr operon transcriptional regulator/uracil phosphoribosyltransferase PyrR [Rothia sp. (in: high G+C Gram-positive bacteria)]MDO5750687.1 bifunctional pyr operon transcriptional regulator/uracil phosphoribosyltransferase PyrR [Rothia sp. (in: high G+C Gram-positive bacteria)]